MVEPAETLERSRRKARHHWETLDVLRRRRDEYEALCRELRVTPVDGTRLAAELARSLQLRLAALLPTAEAGPRFLAESVGREPNVPGGCERDERAAAGSR
mgnify:CR=1 FL=1